MVMYRIRLIHKSMRLNSGQFEKGSAPRKKDVEKALAPIFQELLKVQEGVF